MELMNALIDIYSNNNWEHRYYLDVETGKVVKDLDESIFDEPESEWDENTNIDRYLEIPRATSSDSLHLMQQFVKQMESESVSTVLSNALERSEKEFEDTLSELGLTKRWIPFKGEYFKEQILDWLDVEELSYDELNKMGGK